MKFTAKVLESARKVTADIAKALQSQVQSVFKKAKPKIQRDISRLIGNSLRTLQRRTCTPKEAIKRG